MARQNKVKRLRLALFDDTSHDTLWVIRRSRPRFIIEVIALVLLLAAAFFALIAYTPVRTLIPGYPDSKTQREAIQTALRVDSLQSVVSRWELYSTNLLRVIDGEEPLKLDSLLSGSATETVGDAGREYLNIQDSVLRSIVQQEEQFSISAKSEKNLSIESMHFFVPLKGAVSRGYEVVTHPYVDVVAPANSAVMAVLDGTVISEGWSDEYGYVIYLQHADDIISIYRHNQKLLKRIGDKVTAGTTIALVGNAGTTLGEEHLQFELWYKGEPVDPSKYIKF